MPDISWPCLVEGCDQSFKTMQEADAHMKTHGSNAQKKVSRPTPVVEKKPIILTYRYTGSCDCGREVETIELELGRKTKVTLVAYCPHCKKSVEEMTVDKL